MRFCVLALAATILVGLQLRPLIAADAPAAPAAGAAKPVRLEDAVASLPSDALPDPKHGWDEFTLPKARGVLREQLKNAPLEATCKVEKIEVKRVPDGKNKDKTIGWRLVVEVPGYGFDAYGLSHWVTLLPPGANMPTSATPPKGKKPPPVPHFTFDVPESLAKEARDWKVGMLIVISGTVENLNAFSKPHEVGPAGVNFYIALRDPQFRLAPTEQASQPPASVINVPAAKSIAATARAKLQARELELLKTLEAQPDYQSADEAVQRAQSALNRAHEDKNDAAIATAASDLGKARQKLAAIRQKAYEADPQWSGLKLESNRADATALAAEKAAVAANKVFHFEDAIAALPADARPDSRKRGWDEFSMPKAQASLRQQLKGKRIEVVCRLYEADIERKFDKKDKEKTIGWQLNLRFQSQQFKAYGKIHTLNPSTVDPRGYLSGCVVQIATSEATAKTARDWKRNDKITMSGIVDEVKGNVPSLDEIDGGGFVVILSDVRVERVVPATAEKPEKSPTAPGTAKPAIPQRTKLN